MKQDLQSLADISAQFVDADHFEQVQVEVNRTHATLYARRIKTWPSKRFEHLHRIVRARNVTARIVRGYLVSAKGRDGTDAPVSFYKEITFEQGSDRVLSVVR